MILYLDTSALVKLYFDEDDSKEVRRLVHESRGAATSIVAYAETRAAFARKKKEGGLSTRSFSNLVSGFHKDWPAYFRVNLTNELVLIAGDLAEKHSMRGFDAIHLASALELMKKLDSALFFIAYDERLMQAARDEEFQTPERL
jgi:predicted nucleic acid-binding protein